MPKSEILFKVVLTDKGEIWLRSKFIKEEMHLGPAWTTCVLETLGDCSDYEDMKEIEANLEPLIKKIQSLDFP